MTTLEIIMLLAILLPFLFFFSYLAYDIVKNPL